MILLLRSTHHTLLVDALQVVLRPCTGMWLSVTVQASCQLLLVSLSVPASPAPQTNHELIVPSVWLISHIWLGRVFRACLRLVCGALLSFANDHVLQGADAGKVAHWNKTAYESCQKLPVLVNI